jgi:uncharacterized membrane protein
MARLSSLLFGLSIGAGLMYLFDPDAGNRRRSEIRDQAVHLRNRSDDAIESGVNDLRNRAKGLLAEASGRIGTEPVSDHVLEERVRSRLGMLTRHSSAINVDVHDRKVILSGDVLSNETDKIYTGVATVRGISGVENRMTPHESAEHIPALQTSPVAQERRTGSMWTPSTRLVAGMGGGLMALWGASRGGLIGRLMSIAGWGLAIRAATNVQLGSLLGMTDERRVIRVQKNIQIPAPVERVYDFWSNYKNFPSFMSHVREVRDLGSGRSHWVVEGPAGTPIEWDAVTTRNVPNQVIAWESVPDAMVRNIGEVRFQRQGDQSTQVNVKMYYNPPAGAIGHAITAMFGADPKKAMDDDLNAMKNLLTREQSGQQSGRQRAQRGAGPSGEMGSPEEMKQRPFQSEERGETGRQSGVSRGGTMQSQTGQSPIPRTGGEQDREEPGQQGSQRRTGQGGPEEGGSAPTGSGEESGGE